MTEGNRRLDEHLKYLKLPFIREHYQRLAAQAAEKQLPTSTTSKNSPTARPPSAAIAPSSAAFNRPASR